MCALTESLLGNLCWRRNCNPSLVLLLDTNTFIDPDVVDIGVVYTDESIVAIPAEYCSWNPILVFNPMEAALAASMLT